MGEQLELYPFGRGEGPNIKAEEFKFNWRSYLKHPEKIPADLVDKLNFMADFINESKETDAVEIKQELVNEINDGSLRKPVTALVMMMRGYLSSEERSALSKALTDAEEIRSRQVHKNS